MFCKKCGNLMMRVMSFTGEKAYEFNRCPVCYEETKHLPLIFKEQEANQERKRKTINKKNRQRKSQSQNRI